MLGTLAVGMDSKCKEGVGYRMVKFSVMLQLKTNMLTGNKLKKCNPWFYIESVYKMTIFLQVCLLIVSMLTVYKLKKCKPPLSFLPFSVTSLCSVLCCLQKFRNKKIYGDYLSEKLKITLMYLIWKITSIWNAGELYC